VSFVLLKAVAPVWKNGACQPCAKPDQKGELITKDTTEALAGAIGCDGNTRLRRRISGAAVRGKLSQSCQVNKV
jgi:hypothetical protein